MLSGMIWLDAGKSRSFEEKINRAMSYYMKKFGMMPELCYVSDEIGVSAETLDRPIAIKTNHNLRPDHFWLGRRLN